ncbi:CbtA family protein [Halorientalis halophila]|uniref:CbtA family protein n=1 Tax=Halorientalis halophila TaxID=3108499 RepID=UPI00300B3DBC
MLQPYLVRGLKAGLVAGVAFGLFVAILANPMIAAAEGLAGEHGYHGEDGHAGDDQGGHHDAGGAQAGESGLLSALSPPLLSVLGGVFWALLLGVVTFGLAFYFLEPAIPGTGAGKSAVAGATGFVTVSGAPWLVFPPQPPGVEAALSIDARMGLYAGLMLAGLCACLLAGYWYDRLRDRGRGRAIAGAAVPFTLLVGLTFVLPANPGTGALPAAFVAAFRAQVLFGQVVLWTLLAGTHAWLSRRASGPAADRPAETVRRDAPSAAD